MAPSEPAPSSIGWSGRGVATRLRGGEECIVCIRTRAGDSREALIGSHARVASHTSRHVARRGREGSDQPMDRWRGGCSRTSLVMPWLWPAGGGRAYRAVWLWRSEDGARRREARRAGGALRPARGRRGAVPDGLVASYDAEARAYNPDHDVYILAYYQCAIKIII